MKIALIYCMFFTVIGALMGCGDEPKVEISISAYEGNDPEKVVDLYSSPPQLVREPVINFLAHSNTSSEEISWTIRCDYTSTTWNGRGRETYWYVPSGAYGICSVETVAKKEGKSSKTDGRFGVSN